MKVRSMRRGFTIVELLVVISIIAMLSAVLLPAVNQARSAARQMACINNQGQLAKAMQQYAASKDRLPSYISAFPGAPPATEMAVGWVYPILPQIDRKSVRDAIDREFLQGTTNDDLPDRYLSILVCPDDPIISSIDAGPMSYAANGGLSDVDGTASPDWRDNGSMGRSYLRTGSSNNTPVRTSLDNISSNDGVTTTILLAENVVPLTGPERATWGPQPITNAAAAKYYEISQVILWDETIVDPTTFSGFGSAVGNWTREDYLTDTNLVAAMMPSSTHSGGFVVAFCDGHVKFMSDLVSYDVYARAMTSNGALARPVGTLVSDLQVNSTTGQPIPIPAWQLNPITERDIDP